METRIRTKLWTHPGTGQVRSYIQNLPKLLGSGTKDAKAWFENGELRTKDMSAQDEQALRELLDRQRQAACDACRAARAKLGRFTLCDSCWASAVKTVRACLDILADCRLPIQTREVAGGEAWHEMERLMAAEPHVHGEDGGVLG